MSIILVCLVFVTIMFAGTLVAHAQQASKNLPEEQGYAARVSFEVWLAGLKGDQRRGADFWSGERSIPKPISCFATKYSLIAEFVLGCQEAQRRLSLPDVRRRTEPEYRKGWNSYASTTDLAQPASAAAPILQTHTSAKSIANSQVGSIGIGMTVSQIKAAYPRIKCESNIKMCYFGKNQISQQLCPKLGPCSKLNFYTNGINIIGYSADFRRQDWLRSLNASKFALGVPKEKIIGPSKIVKMRNHYWTWKINDGLELSYTATSGVNFYGAPLDAHNIIFFVKR